MSYRCTVIPVESPEAPKRKSAGFTLIELLVVIAILALLVSLLMPSLRLSKELAKDAICRAHYHSLALALPMYAEDNNGYTCPYVENGLIPGGSFLGPDGYRYNKMGRYALVTCWYEPGSYPDPLRGGDGYLGRYAGSNRHRFSKQHILSCPTYPEGPEYERILSYAVPFDAYVYRAKSFSHNMGMLIDPATRRYGPPRPLSDFHWPAQLVFMCDGSATNGYVRAPTDDPDLDLWQKKTSVPVAKHLGQFNMLFVDGHVEGGEVEAYYNEQYFNSKGEFVPHHPH